jgi:hypothetical protein
MIDFKLFNELYSSRSRKRRPRGSVQNGKHANVNFLKLDSPEGIQNGVLQKDNGIHCILMPSISMIRNSFRDNLMTFLGGLKHITFAKMQHIDICLLKHTFRKNCLVYDSL